MAEHHFRRNSLGLRLLIIAVLSLLLLIPANMIHSLVQERQQRRDAAVQEISEKWGESQIITGPILSIPLQDSTKVYFAHFLPEALVIEGSIDPEVRYRGIHEVALYNSSLDISGRFSYPDFNLINGEVQDIRWDDAFLTIGISDMKGIKDVAGIRWNQEEYAANPGVISNDLINSGISIRPSLSNAINGGFEFSTSLSLNGSSKLMFTPVGKTTDLGISSTWQNPSFTGNFLPESRQISASGFDAKWKILHLNRNYPQQWVGSQFNPSTSTFGVDLYLPVDEYQKTTRTVKYAIMFISLTFLSFFLIELLTSNNIHPMQYLLVGFALLLFYTLLLSLSEHIGFRNAYILSSTGIIGLITVYSRSVLRTVHHTIIVLGILILLYGFLYIVLQLQDYALLIGSLGLFVTLAGVMYLTKNIDWFSILTNGSRQIDPEP